MCRAHLFPDIIMEDADFLAKGVRFGKGLQLINILRDLAADLGHGRCYLPVERLKTCGLSPTELLQPENEPRMRACYDSYLDMAEDHLMAGWDYTHTIPRRFVRVRLACAWPLLIGRETLMLLRAGKVLDPSHRIKVTRSQVRRILWRSVVFYPWPNAWRALFPTATDVLRQ
jgi:farnesyl-diphosphate farnesyltransferase